MRVYDQQSTAMPLERAGKFALAACTLVTMLMIGASITFEVAADDLFKAYDALRQPTAAQVRTAQGRWLSAQLANGIDFGDATAVEARATVLAYQSDRVRELAAAPAVVGLLVALLTDAPASPNSRPRSATSQPVANTTSNGSA